VKPGYEVCQSKASIKGRIAKLQQNELNKLGEFELPKKSTAKAVGFVMILMLISRSMSLVSSLVYTTYFGNTLEINIYSYAIQFPLIVFNTFGTALATVIIPIFAGYLGKGEKNKAFSFANNVISLSIAFTIILTVLGWLIAPILPRFTEFKNNGYQFTVEALRIMFPVMIFYALNYILQGILQSFERYNMPAFVSVPSSLAVIGYVLLFGGRYGVRGLLVATFIGLSLQGLVLIPPVFKTEYRYKPSFNFKDDDIKKAVKLMLPVVIGSSAYQFNMFFNVTMVANYENAVTITTIVQNLILYSVLAFVYSITAVVFPRMTIMIARNNMEQFKTSLNKIIRTLSFFLIPATFGFVAVRSRLIDFLVGWGKITRNEVDFAAIMLALYAIGILGIGIKEVVDRAFYSMNNTRMPAYNGLIIMIANVAAVLSLQPFLGVYAIPLGYSVSILIGAVSILYMIRKRIGAFGVGKILQSLFKNVFASIIMLIVVVAFNILLNGISIGYTIIDKAAKLIIPSFVGAAAFFGVAYILKTEEARDIAGNIAKRVGVLLGKVE